MSNIDALTSRKPDISFALIIAGQEVRVRYRADCPLSGHAHLAFSSLHNPAQRLPLSETGYRSHFFPMRDVDEAESVEIYAYTLALALMSRQDTPGIEADSAVKPWQMPLF